MGDSRDTGPEYATLDDWILNETIPFDPARPESFRSAVDHLTSVHGSMEVLGFGEALHGSTDILLLRNRLFRHLVEYHGFRSLAIESSFSRGREVDRFIAGAGPDSYDAIQESGFSHGFGRLEANRELVEWMKEYNTNPPDGVKLRFYGFDSPTEMMYADTPRRLLEVALGYLESADSSSGREFQERLMPYLKDDKVWEDPAAMMEPAKSVGLSLDANILRAGTEDLLAELQMHCPDMTGAAITDQYRDAVHCAEAARQLLAYHAIMARVSKKRFIRLLGMRDAMMGDNLAYIASRERGRGRVFVFAHNSHLQRGKAEWRLGKTVHAWWPAGAHLNAVLGSAFAVIGSGIICSAGQGIGSPGPGTLEARIAAVPGPARFVPTRRGCGLPPAEIASLPVRAASAKNSTYFALIPQSISGFDWLVVVDSVA